METSQLLRLLLVDHSTDNSGDNVLLGVIRHAISPIIVARAFCEIL